MRAAASPRRQQSSTSSTSNSNVDENGRPLTTITNFVEPSTPTKSAPATPTAARGAGLPPTPKQNNTSGARRPSLTAAASPRSPLAVARKEAKNVRVYLRVRPAHEAEDSTAVQCGLEDPCVVTLRGSRHYYADPSSDMLAELEQHNGPPQERNYAFEQVFGPRTTQTEVYATVAKQTVQDVFDGYHGLLFAYGQTGSGKTHTLCNRKPGEEGIIVQAVREIFGTIQSQQEEFQFECSMQMVQLYQEQFQDLLAPEMPVVQLHDDPELDAGGVYLDGSSCRTIQTAEQCLSLYRMADERRTTANTMMNEKSSRSHTVFVLNVHKKRNPQGASDQSADQSELRGRLIIVDLAGSERNRKTGATGIRLNEAKAINTSLLLLGRVVDALTDPTAHHVPFRDSKLTRFLQYALAGNGKTSIIITVSPSTTQFEETHGAIMFGQRARKVKYNAKVHTTVDYKALAFKLQAMLAAQEEQLRAQLGADSTAELRAKDERIAELEEMVAALQAELEAKDRCIAELRQRVEDLTQRGEGDRAEAGALRARLAELERQLDSTQREKDDVSQALRQQNDRLLAQVRQLEQDVASLQPSPATAMSCQTGATILARNGPSDAEQQLQRLLRAAQDEARQLREQVRQLEQSNEYLVDELESLQAGDYHHSGCKDKSKKNKLFIHREGKKKKADEYVAKAAEKRTDFISSHNHLKCNQYALVHQADASAEVWKGVVTKSRTGSGVNVIFDSPEALLASLPADASAAESAAPPVVAAIVSPRRPPIAPSHGPAAGIGSGSGAGNRSRSYNPYDAGAVTPH